jgi:hypothetical protein
LIRKIPSSIPEHVRVVFELPSGIWADRVFVVGDFNQWNESELPMSADRDGSWQASLDLPAGTRHEFRYLIDGEWLTDYHADGWTMNDLGTENSIVLAELPEPYSALRAESTSDSGLLPADDASRNLMEKWLARRRKLDTAA